MFRVERKFLKATFAIYAHCFKTKSRYFQEKMKGGGVI